MKNIYHLCLTAHDEVLIRNEEDARQMIILSALASSRTETVILTDAEMSTHLHQNICATNPRDYYLSLSESLAKDFNRRHNRSGRLFDKKPFILQLQGPNHIQMSLCYSLRQGVHHGAVQTAFEYPWCSANALFRHERGVSSEKALLSGAAQLHDLFPKGADIPDSWEVGKDGILLRRCFEDIRLVETWFGTAKSYMFSMNRKTSDEWLKEQEKDGLNEPPVTLNLLERGYSAEDISRMLQNEGNAKYNHRRISDMEICKLIDKEMLGRYHVQSVYELDITQKLHIVDELRYDAKCSNIQQLSRCVALKY